MSDLINILVPDAFPDANAVGRATHMMAKGLVANGTAVVVAARWRSAETGWSAPEGIETKTFGVFDRTKRKRLGRMAWLSSAMAFSMGCCRRILGAATCTIFYGASPLFLPAAWMGRLLRKPMAFVQYDLYRPTTLDSGVKQRAKSLYRFTEGYLARSARMLVLSESQLLIDHLKAQAPDAKIFPNWPPTDSHYFSAGSRERGRKFCAVEETVPLIIYVGAINRLEGVDILITAMKGVVAQRPDCILAIAGPVVGDILPGLPPDYLGMPKELGIEKNVRFLGTVNKDVVRDLLAAADCLVMPKRDHEGNEAASPIKLGEYLASGRPVVASRVCGIDRWLSNGESIMLAQPGDPADLARTICEVISDPHRAKAIGLRGQREGERHCDFKQWGRAFKESWNEPRNGRNCEFQCV